MIYPDNFEVKIGFDRIRRLLSERCISPMGLSKVDNIKFLNDFDAISLEISKTYEFQKILQFEDYFPSDNYYDISECLGKIRIEGSFPEVQEVFDLKRSLEAVKSILNFFRSKDFSVYPSLKAICNKVKIYPYILDSIDKIIDKKGIIRDNASPKLKEIRSELAAKSTMVSKRLNAILKQAQADGSVDTDASVSIRNGRGVIPVNANDKRRIRGLIHDQSATGKTIYIEPAEIVEINNDIIELEYEERREIVRILTTFADNIRPYLNDLNELNMFLGEIDFLRAKALLGNHIKSIKPVIINKQHLFWRKAIHPLLLLAFEKLPGRKVIPLDISLDEKARILLISGPNAGGKSVCLKTVGLLQYMVQCGITIPVAEGSDAGIFKNIFIDIGDEQSIDNDLSTYSSHLINMKYFIKNASAETLVLIDEFGTGTEPILGGSIAESILGELNKLRVFGVLTTHYTNLKHFASLTEGIVNGAMAFDNHLMQPLFQLIIGRPGNSFAYEIAKKIGLPDEILRNAASKAGVKNINYDRNLKDIARDKRYWETKRQNIRQKEKRLEELINEYEKELAGAKSLGKEIVSRARDEASSLLNESNKIIENTIRQIKEAQAEKEKTKELRHQLEEFKSSLTDDIYVSKTATEMKVTDLNAKAKRFRKNLSAVKKEPEKAKEKPLSPGDAVRVKDTMVVGEIIKIKADMVQVETDNLKIYVPVEKIERISRTELNKNIKANQITVSRNREMNQKKIMFNPDIDIRGLRAEEALRIVRDLIDNAIIVRHRNLRILHGKGNGVLRQLVRQFLSTMNIVKTYQDEHVDLGGSGITIVELDL